MKALISFILLPLFLIVSGFGQIQTKATLGINSFDFSVKKGEGRIFDQEPKLGYHGGLSVAIGNKFIIEPGIFYYLLNSEMSIINKSNTESVRTMVDIQILRIPVLFGYSVAGSQRSPVNLRLFAGPSLSVVTFVSAQNSAADIGKNDFEDFYLGAKMGAGVNLGIFFFDATLDAGLMNFLKDDQGSAKNNSFSLNLGMRF